MTFDFYTRSLEIAVAGCQRAFAYRPDSVGDIGVIRQIFERKDYDFSRLAVGPSFTRYVDGIRASGRRPLIIDAGANIGASPIYFLSQYPDAAIVAIEPERRNCELLRANCHDLDVRIIEAALDSHPGVRFLSDPGRGDWGFRVLSPSREQTVPTDQKLYEVHAVTVPQVLRDYPSDTYGLAIVKIDIEGGEKDLFAGASGWLEIAPLVIVELHDWMLPGEAVSRNFLRAISTYDFDFIYFGENVFCFNNTRLRAL